MERPLSTTDDLDLHDDTDDDSTDDGDGNALIRKLRTQLKAANKRASRVDDLESEVSTLKRREQVRKAGLDLTDAQLAALAKVHDGDDTPEALKATAVALGWATDEGGDEQQAQVDQAAATQQRISAAQNGATAASNSVLKPEEVNGWATDRLMALNDKHPEIFEALMRGETVAAPIGF
jgi:hypothetical protein